MTTECPILRTFERQSPTREDLGEESFAVLVSNVMRALAAGIVYTANDYAAMCAAGADAYEVGHSLWAAFKSLEEFDKLTDPALVAAKKVSPLMDDQLAFALVNVRRAVNERGAA